ncbi:MAG: substrate-binding domain-containing protein [Prevotella sp.]|nr:substrate-binding domain-containing protein [Prevotella sp.]
MSKTLRTTFVCVVASLLLVSCTTRRPHYVIGVSQCSQDIWRDKLNDELKMSSYFYEGVELRFASADDSDQRQIEQIDQFVSDGVDLLIVAPNQVTTVTPAIDRAFDSGIPVIVFDRRTSSKKFTAHIGADNYEMGHQMGEYIAAQLKGKGRVMEILGLKGSSPAIERHNGFADALSAYPGITLVASLQGDWTEKSAVTAVEQFAAKLPQGEPFTLDFVFGQNDRMALGASKALQRLGLTQTSQNTGRVQEYCGIDGLPGEDGGIRMVQDSVLDASYIYPTRGDMVMQLAMNILLGKPFERENMMKSAIVTNANATVMLMQAEEMSVQSDMLDSLHDKVDWYFTQYRHQQVYMVLLGIIILLLVAGSWYIIRTMVRRHEMEREAFELVVGVNQSSVPAPATTASPTSASAPEAEVGKTATETDTLEASASVTAAPAVSVPQESPFLEQLRQYVQEGMADSNFSVETLAEKMNLSRVQFYRKVKLLTGRTPVDIIRQSRLNRARTLLQTTDKTISEVAYDVGFSAPSYFTKCFKDEFGISPSDL